MFGNIEKVIVTAAYTQRLDVAPLEPYDLENYTTDSSVISEILEANLDIRVLYGWQRKFFSQLTGLHVPVFVFGKHIDLGTFLRKLGVDNKTLVFVLEGKDFSYYYDPKSKARFVFLPSFASLLPYTRKATGGNKLHIEVSLVELRKLVKKTQSKNFWKLMSPFPSFKSIPVSKNEELVLVNLGRSVIPSNTRRIQNLEDLISFEESLRNAKIVVFDVETVFPFSSSKVTRYEEILESKGLSIGEEYEFDGSDGKVVSKILPVTEVGILVRKKDGEDDVFYVSASPKTPYYTLSDLFNSDEIKEEFRLIIEVCKRLVETFKREDVLIVGHNVKFDIVKVFQMLMVEKGQIFDIDEIEENMPRKLWDTLVYRISRNTMASPNALKRLAGIMGYPDWGDYLDASTEEVFWEFTKIVDYENGTKSSKWKKYFPSEWGKRTPYIWGDFLSYLIEAARSYMKSRRKSSVERKAFPDWSEDSLPDLDQMYKASQDDNFRVALSLAQEIFEKHVGLTFEALKEAYEEKWADSFWYFAYKVIDNLWRVGTWADYNLIDIVATAELFEIQYKDFEKTNKRKTILDVIYPFLIKVESSGVKIDIERYLRMRKQLGNKLKEVSPEMFGVSSEDIPKATQTVKLLSWFKELGVKYGEEYLTSLSTTSKSTLEKLIEENEGDPPGIKNEKVRSMAVGVAHYVLLHRLLSKVGNLYSKHWLRRYTVITPQGVFIFPTFNIDGTASGRLSSSDPNMQNLPSDRALFSAQKHFPELEEVFKFKKLIRSKFDWGAIADVDFSQAEVRVMVIFTRDPVMYRAYDEGRDVYRVNASLVTGIPEDQIDDETRQFFKMITLGTMYGAGVKRLVSLGIPEEKAREFKEKFDREFPSLSKYIEWVRFNFDRDWTGVSLFRRRSFGDLIPKDLMKIEEFKKLIRKEFPSFINMPIQSASSDLTVLAAIELSNILRSFGLKTHVINMVHDSIVLDIPEEELYTIQQIVESFFDKKLYSRIIKEYWEYIEYEVKPLIDLNKICPSKADFEIVSKYSADAEKEVKKV